MKKLLLLNLFMLIGVLEICAQQIYSDKSSDNNTFYSGCSVITISKGDSVFFGGNDDYINQDSLANPRHLKTETAQLLRTPQIKLDENLSWGMGPGIYYSEKGYALWQWGQHVDVQSIMIIYPESKSGVVVCTNNDLLNPDVALEIGQRALGENFNTIRKAIHLNYDYSKR